MPKPANLYVLQRTGPCACIRTAVYIAIVIQQQWYCPKQRRFITRPKTEMPMHQPKDEIF